MVDAKYVCIVQGKISDKDLLVASLNSEGFSVEVFSSEEFNRSKPEGFKGLYIIDLDLIGRAGVEIISEIRKKDYISPIFVISSNEVSEDKIKCLSQGADDYIIKSNLFDEVILKANNTLNKLYLLKTTEPWSEEVRLLPEANSFIKNTKAVSLTNREYIIFSHLYKNLGQAVSRQELIEQFSDESMTERNIDVHIFSLRKKVKSVEATIGTVWGTGYKMTFV